MVRRLVFLLIGLSSAANAQVQETSGALPASAAPASGWHVGLEAGRIHSPVDDAATESWHQKKDSSPIFSFEILKDLKPIGNFEVQIGGLLTKFKSVSKISGGGNSSTLETSGTQASVIGKTVFRPKSFGAFGIGIGLGLTSVLSSRTEIRTSLFQEQIEPDDSDRDIYSAIFLTYRASDKLEPYLSFSGNPSSTSIGISYAL